MKGGMAVVAVPFFGYNGGDYPCVPKSRLCIWRRVGKRALLGQTANAGGITMRDRQAPRRALAALCAVLFLGGIFVPAESQAAVIADRVKAVTREYPHGSYFHDRVTVSYVKNGVLWHYTGHECAGFVMHVTKRAFQNPYYIGAPDYGLVYKTVSTKNIEEMKTLFSYAKIGDVIRWTGKGGIHQAVFMESNKRGVQVYEANFGNDYNRVWYNHLWPWNNRALWTGTSSNVSVYRYKDYKEIDRMVTDVSLNRSRCRIKKKKSFRLTAQVSPASAYNKKVSWKSTNPKVAKVSAKGVVKAKKKGRAFITATAKDGSGRKASCKVTVK